MAVSKRLRFEIFRRDNHTCRYCGLHAPDTELRVDHVVPVALGGTDEPGNLVAACEPCNSGKTSIAPGSPLVEGVREDAIRHAEMIRQAYAITVERMGKQDDYCQEVIDHYTGETTVPSDWQDSVGRWFEMGVPIELVIEAAEKASRSRLYFKTALDRFSYMAGIVWNQVHVVNESVELKSHITGAFLTEVELSNRDVDAYHAGLSSAERHGDIHSRMLSDVVDRIETVWF